MCESVGVDLNPGAQQGLAFSHGPTQACEVLYTEGAAVRGAKVAVSSFEALPVEQRLIFVRLLTVSPRRLLSNCQQEFLCLQAKAGDVLPIT